MWYTAAMKKIICFVIVPAIAIGSFLADVLYSQQLGGPDPAAQPPAHVSASSTGAEERDLSSMPSGTVEIDPAKQQIVGIRVGRAERKTPRPHHPAARTGRHGRDPHLLHQCDGRRVDHENPAQHHGQPRQERRDAGRLLQSGVSLCRPSPSFCPWIQRQGSHNGRGEPGPAKTRSPNSTSISSSTRTLSRTWAWATSRSRR